MAGRELRHGMNSSVLAQFRSPGPQYRAISFWALNGRLEGRELIRQLDYFRTMGLGGSCLHARSGLQTRYLSQQWLGLMRQCVQHARRQRQRIWLYDEDRYPSGAAGGLVTRHPQFRQKRLWLQIVAPGQRPRRHDAIAWFALCGSITRIQSVRRVRSAKDRSSGETLLGFHVVQSPLNSWYNGYTYLDTMSPAAVRAFLQSTYARYHRALGKHFGKTIEGIFTDEPNRGPSLTGFWGDFIEGYKEAELLEIPWTPRLPEEFRRRYGYDLIDHLPELYFDIAGRRVSQARYHFYDLTTALFCEAFGGTIGPWCARHRVALLGHVQGEETPSSQTNLVGAAMRSYPHFQMPGVDILTDQNHEYDTVIQCASVANQMGCPWVVSEMYGCTGWNFPFEGHKAVGDWQLALGVTRRCLHLAFYTMAGAAKRDYPASISFQSAWSAQYRKVEDYYARLTAVLSRGRPVRSVLVIHPVESTWLRCRMGWDRKADVKQLDRNLKRISDALLCAHVNFDYGDEVLLKKWARVSNRSGTAIFKVGKMAYPVVIVPPMQTIRSNTLNLLRDFARKGGRLIWVGSVPDYVDAAPSAAAHELAATCERIRKLHGRLRNLSPVRMIGKATTVLHQLRRAGQHSYLFLCNTNRRQGTGTITLSLAAKGQVQEWDAATGGRFAVASVQRPDGVSFRTDLPPCGSRLFVIGSKARARLPFRPCWRETRRQPLPAGCWRYELSELNPLVLDYVRIQLPGRSWSSAQEVLKADAWLRRQLGWQPRRFHDIQPWKQARGRGPAYQVRVQSQFDLRGNAPTKVELAIEHIPGVRTVQINGHRVDHRRDSGWWVDPCFRRHKIEPHWLHDGANNINFTIDYASQSGLEASYLLSSHAVEANTGCATLKAPPPTLRVGDITRQGFPFYGASLTYKCTIKPTLHPRERLFLLLDRWVGCCAVVRLDGREVGRMLWPPYETELPVVNAQEYELAIEIVLGRGNTFGPLHRRGKVPPWVSPFEWETSGAKWLDRYRLSPSGLTTRPLLVYRRRLR